MNELRLIILREYFSRVKKKTFIVFTILLPLLFVASLSIPYLLSQIKDSEEKHIAVIDNTGEYGSYLKSKDSYVFEVIDDGISTLKQNLGNDLFAIIQINDDLSKNPSGVVLFSEKQVPTDLLSYLNNTFSTVVKSKQIDEWTSRNAIDPILITELRAKIENPSDINITTIRLDDQDERESSSVLSSIIGVGFTFLMYIFILFYGSMVLNGVIEEKTSRIVEVLICTVRPFNLMMGKIIGIGLTGLTQLVIWLFFGSFLFLLVTIFGDTILDDTSLNMDLLLSVNWVEIFIYFVLYFVGGYLIYASIFAMFGAMVDNAQDTQQFMMPVTIIFLFAFYAAMSSLQNPDGPLAFWCSIIPFTSPIVMMVRLPFGVPLWEKLLSVVILYLTIVFFVKIAAKIYRIGILMYGKKMSAKELIGWVIYKN